MENLTAKQLEEKIGFQRNMTIFIGEFQFVIYVDYDINAKFGGGRLYININNEYSEFNNVIDLEKQYTTTDNVVKDIRKQLRQLQKRITKALNE